MYQTPSLKRKNSVLIRVTTLCFALIIASFFLPQYKRPTSFDEFHRNVPLIITMKGLASYGLESFLHTLDQAPVLWALYGLGLVAIITFIICIIMKINRQLYILPIGILTTITQILSSWTLLFQHQYEEIFIGNGFIPGIYVAWVASMTAFITNILVFSAIKKSKLIHDI